MKDSDTAGIFTERLEQNLQKNSGWQQRDYLGLSHVTRHSCKRRMYFEAFAEYSEMPAVNGLSKCREGYVLERDLQEQIKEAGFELRLMGQEFLPFPGFKKIRFHIDGLLRIDGIWYLLEIKHRNNHKFIKFLQEKIPNETYDQVQGYLHFLRPPRFNPPVNRAMLLVKNIETGQMAAILLKYNYIVGIKLQKILLEMRKHIEAKRVPERGFEVGAKACKYCPYVGYCGEADEREAEAMAERTVIITREMAMDAGDLGMQGHEWRI